jgi:NAD(P)H-flavin reductase
MSKVFTPIKAKILEIIDETPTIKTFVLKPEEEFNFLAGQFAALTCFGIGEGFFTPSSSPYDKEKVEFTIMRVGRVTNGLFNLKKGEFVGLRGPFGKPYPLDKFEGREVFIVGGGVGMAPLRSLFLAILHNLPKYKKVYIRYGARTPKDLVYKNSLFEWQKIENVDVELTVDVGDETWQGKVGVVTILLDEIPCDVNTACAVVCGPPLMMKFTLQKLLEKGFQEENIYLSMEKNMSCAVGMCGHCRMGKYFICQDGPVLTYKEIKTIEDPFI